MGRDECCVGNDIPRVSRIVLRGRSKHDTDAVVVEDTLVALLQQEGLGDGLVRLNQDRANICNRCAVDKEHGTIGVGIFSQSQTIV